MRIDGPRNKWARYIIQTCTESRPQRIQRGRAFRNIFLTGDENAVPQTYLRTQDFVRDVLSFLYSPSDLRYRIDFFGQVGPVDRAKASAAAAFLHQHIIDADMDDSMTDVTLWSLIKGKTIQQTLWSRRGLESHLIQPESFGVYNESISDLDKQEAWVHTTFLTRSRFRQLISGLPPDRQRHLMKAASDSIVRGREGEDGNSVLKQIVVGGLYPYTATGQTPVSSGGQVQYLFGPEPQMQPGMIDEMIPYDELWFWNDDQDDWATITMIGEEIVFGKDELFNAFSQQSAVKDTTNPLHGKHGFTEFCAMPLDGYFWGISYVFLVALLQKSINNRIDGINTMLRKQEDPPRAFMGSTSINQNAYAKLNKPGGYFSDSSPNAKIEDLAKQIPADLWTSFHEWNNMFDVIGGFPPVAQGMGEGSVRSAGQTETLLRTGAARHKDASLKIERSVERVGGTAFSLLQAKTTDVLTAWVMPGVQSPMIDDKPDPTLEPPAPGMKPVSFSLRHMNERAKVTVDSHSASPAFRQEARELLFALNRIGAASPRQVVEGTHPAQEDALIEGIEQREIAQQQLIAQHPELLTKGGHGKPH